jgi:hypothetical protein
MSMCLSPVMNLNELMDIFGVNPSFVLQHGSHEHFEGEISSYIT